MKKVSALKLASLVNEVFSVMGDRDVTALDFDIENHGIQINAFGLRVYPAKQASGAYCALAALESWLAERAFDTEKYNQFGYGHASTIYYIIYQDEEFGVNIIRD